LRKANYTAIVLAMSLLIFWAGHSPALGAEYDTRQEVIDLIKAYYPHPVDDAVFARPSARMVVEGLNDPHSEYMSMDELNLFMGDLDGSFCGIGVVIEMLTQGMLITDTIPDSPAQSAGLQAGDVITAVNDRLLAGLSEEEARILLQGRAGSRVKITVMRDAQQLVMFLKRADLAVPSVLARQLDDGVAYLAVMAFGINTAEEMGQYIRRLDAVSDQWIVDLRGNSGGYIMSAAEIAGYFLNVGNLVILQQKEERVHLPVMPQSSFINEPVIFLTDEYSASAAELLAAAVKDYRRALLLGETTYGKGTMQEIFVLQNGDVLKLTVAQFYSPFGKKINQLGVQPDLQILSQEAVEAARLLLSKPRGGSSLARIEAGGQKYLVDLELAREQKHWQSWAGLTAAVNSFTVDSALTSQMHTISLSAQDIARRWPVYYPDYGFLGEFHHLPQAGPLYLSLDGLDDYLPENAAALELIDSRSGQRVAFDLHRQGTLFCLEPIDEMPGSEYWLVWHGLPEPTGQRVPSRPGIAILHYTH
jgi:carboxyl-terminal processing protease